MTTTEDHNKYLAYSHLGYAAFQLLMMFVMGFFSIMFLYIIATETRGDFPLVLAAAILVFSFFFQLFFFTLPSLIAGFGLLKRRRWAKTASIIAGVLSALSFPLGTAVTLHTFWFLFGRNGKELYDRPAVVEEHAGSDYFLDEPEGENLVGRWRERKRQREYVPPTEMPNWRD